MTIARRLNKRGRDPVRSFRFAAALIAVNVSDTDYPITSLLAIPVSQVSRRFVISILYYYAFNFARLAQTLERFTADYAQNFCLENCFRPLRSRRLCDEFFGFFGCALPRRVRENPLTDNFAVIAFK